MTTAAFTGKDFKPARTLGGIGGGPTSVDDQFISLDQFGTAVLRAQIERINSFAMLAPGWNQGNGAQITAAARREAIRFLREGLAESRVVAHTSPLESGGVLLEWELGDFGLYVEVAPDGGAEFCLETDDQCASEGAVRSIRPYLLQLQEALLATAR